MNTVRDKLSDKFPKYRDDIAKSLGLLQSIWRVIVEELVGEPSERPLNTLLDNMSGRYLFRVLFVPIIGMAYAGLTIVHFLVLSGMLGAELSAVMFWVYPISMFLLSAAYFGADYSVLTIFLMGVAQMLGISVGLAGSWGAFTLMELMSRIIDLATWIVILHIIIALGIRLCHWLYGVMLCRLERLAA